MRVGLVYKEHCEQHKAPQQTSVRSLALFRVEGIKSTIIYRSDWHGERRDSNEAIFVAGQQWVCITQASIRKYLVTPGFEFFRPVIRELDGWSVGETKNLALDAIPFHQPLFSGVQKAFSTGQQVS
jgi:hypothetical protein